MNQFLKILLVSPLWATLSWAQTATVVWQKTFPNITANGAIQSDIGAAGNILTIAAQSSQFKISAVDITNAQGKVTSLVDLMKSAANSKAYGSGLLDKTGVPTIPSKMTLSLPALDNVASIRVALTLLKAAPGQIQLTLSSNVDTSISPTPITPSHPLPPTNGPTTGPVAPPVVPPVVVVPPPVTSPTPLAPACDGNALNAQIANANNDLRQCGTDVANQKQNLAAAQQTHSLLLQQVAQASGVEFAYNQCRQQTDQMSANYSNLQSAMNQEVANYQSYLAARDQANADINMINSYSGVWTCYIQSRHSQVFRSTERGSPGVIMAKIAKNYCNVNECGKGEDFSWDCRPASSNEIDPIAIPNGDLVVQNGGGPIFNQPSQPQQPPVFNPPPVNNPPVFNPPPVNNPPVSNNPPEHHQGQPQQPQQPQQPAQPAFNELCYLAQNPDVAENWTLSGLQHYQSSGKTEGRRPDCDPNAGPTYTYNEACYRKNNPDVDAAFPTPGTAVQHWLSTGRLEGRAPGCEISNWPKK